MLHIACQQGYLDIVRCLINDCRMDATLKTSDGSTAFLLACQGGHMNKVEYLVQDCRVDAATKANDGRTAFHAACKNGRLNIVIFDSRLSCRCSNKSNRWKNRIPLGLS